MKPEDRAEFSSRWRSPALAWPRRACAEKPVDKPYAAGAPSGGIPLWKPGEKFIGISGGACSGTCPVYELYVFDDGRVVFIGPQGHGKGGVWNKQVEPDGLCRAADHDRAHQGAGRGRSSAAPASRAARCSR